MTQQPTPPGAPPPSCLNCPSMLDTGEATAFFMKSLGVPMCARFGKPIGSAKSTDKQRVDVAKALAKNCSEYGSPRPQGGPDWPNLTFAVAMPDPEVLRFNQRRQQDLVRSCSSCEHLVSASTTLREVGFAAGLCAAKGKLILDNRQTFEGRNCDMRSLSTVGNTRGIGSIMLLPEYSADFALSSDPVKYHQAQMQNFVDPTEYPTDKPVTPDEELSGIRAWRLVEDPESGNSTYLPIYRRDFFDEAEQAKIPSTGDDEHPEDYIDHGFYTYKVAVLWRELDETPALQGPAGVGKTEFFRHMAWLMQLPFERFSFTASSELDDLAGKMHYSPDRGTYWVDGRLVKAWSKPCVLVGDEPNAAPPDVWQFIRPMTDNSKQLVLDMSDDPTPRPRDDNCYLGLAFNPSWDAKNIGVAPISDADANRLMHIWIPLPDPKLEKQIIAKACERDGYDIDPAMIETIMKIADDIRPQCDDDTLPITWGIRPQIKVARATRWFDIKSCYLMAIADHLEPEARQQVLDVVESHVE